VLGKKKGRYAQLSLGGLVHWEEGGGISVPDEENIMIVRTDSL